MTALYWFALVVGVGLYVVSLSADLLGHGDVDASADADLGHAEIEGAGDGFRILSLRNATYALFAFGVSGVALSWIWAGGRPLATAIVATMLGLGGGTLSAFTFRWLRRSDSGELPSDTSLFGMTGRVVIPLTRDGTGKILVRRGSRELELLARPFDPRLGQPEAWIEVMVIDMQDGVALVSPNDPALGAARPQRLAPTSEN